MSAFNLSGTLNIFRVLANPSLCLPHATISTFNDLPIPLSRAFASSKKSGGEKVNIRAVVLDKDDCFAVPKENEVFEPYKKHFSSLLSTYPLTSLLIVSNTAGSSSDPTGLLAQTLQQNVKIPVLKHTTKKPGCGDEIMKHFRQQDGLSDIRPDQIAIVGDRLLTDIVLANRMGSWGIWVKEGVVGWERKSFITKMEQKAATFLLRRGYEAPMPKSQFEG